MVDAQVDSGPVVTDGDPPLDDHVVTELELFGADGGRSPADDADRLLRECTVRLAVPLAVRLPREGRAGAPSGIGPAPGRQRVWTVFPVDLSALGRGRRYASLSLDVALGTTGAVAVGLNPGDGVVDALLGAPDAGPVSTELVEIPSTTGLAPVGSGWQRPPLTGSPCYECSVSGVFTSRFGWRLTPSGAGGPRLRFAAGALLELPEDADSLVCESGAAVVISRSRLGVIHRMVAVSSRTAAFDVPLRDLPPRPSVGPDRRGAPGGHHGPVRHHGPGVRSVRLVVSADVERYSALGPEAAAEAQSNLAAVMDRAVAATGHERAVHIQDQGDCRQVVFPPACDELAAVPAFFETFVSTLRLVNAVRGPERRLRVRVGMDHGHSGRCALGWDGQAAVTAVRVRDSAVVRACLQSAPEAECVLAVSDALYTDVVRQLTVEPSASAFRPVEVDDASHGFAARAWAHVPRTG